MELESSNNADGSFVSIGSVPDDNSSFVVAGFGDTGNGVYSNELLFIRQQLVNRTICEGRLRLNIGPQASLRESEFCLAPVQGESGTDTCYGDAGVPVLKQLNGSFVLVGVGLGGTSRVCAAPNDYGTYVFVQGSQDWIQSVLNGSFPATEEVVPLETRVIGSFILVYIFCGAMFIVAIIFSVNQLVAMRWIECLGCFLVAGFAIVRVIVAALYQASPISYDVISCLSQTTGIWIIWAYGCVLLMWFEKSAKICFFFLKDSILQDSNSLYNETMGAVAAIAAEFWRGSRGLDCLFLLPRSVLAEHSIRHQYMVFFNHGNTNLVVEVRSFLVFFYFCKAAMVVYYALLIIILALRTLHQMNKMKRSIGSSLQLTKRQNQVRKVAFHVLIVAFAALLGIIVLVIGAIGSQLQFWPSAYYSRWVNDCFISALVPMLTCVPILFVFRPHLKCCKPKQRENQAPLTTNSTTKLKELSTDGTLEEMFEKNTMEI